MLMPLVVFHELEVTVALISLGSHRSSGHNHFPVIDPLTNMLFGIQMRSHTVLVYLIVVLIVQLSQVSLSHWPLTQTVRV